MPVMAVVCRGSHRARRDARGAWVVLAFAALTSSPIDAQRPAPPKGWTIDTSGGVPVALRRGGMLSTDTRAELLGPVLREGPALLGWIGTFARSNAATLGTVDPATKDEVSVSTIAGQRVAVAAQSVRTTSGTKYVAYGMLQDTPAGAPVIVVRSTFGDMLTLARAFRSSVEALLPYILTPTDSMRALRTVAMAAAPITSFRGLASSVPPPADTTPLGAAAAPAPAPANAAAAGDSAARAAVSVGIDEAIAALEPAPGAARTPASTRGGGAGAATPRSQPATAGALASLLVKVVFYQFGDLQYHPVALFRDGSSFDVVDASMEQTDATASRTAHAARWGRWRTVGRTYYLSEKAGGPERDYALGGGGFHTAFAAPPGTTLDGTYKAVSGSSMGETSTLLTTQLRFAPDGRFTGARDFAAVGNGQASGVTMAGGASSSTAGRYRVSGHRLVLTYDGGAVKEYFFAFGSGGDPEAIDRDMLFVGSTAYVR